MILVMEHRAPNCMSVFFCLCLSLSRGSGSPVLGGPWSVCTGAEPGPWDVAGKVPHPSPWCEEKREHWLEAGGGQWRPNWYLSCLTAFLPGPQSPHLYTEQVELQPGFQMSGKKGSALVERMEGPGSPIPAPLPAGDAGFWVCHPWVGCPWASTSLDWRYFQLPGGMGMGQRQGLGETDCVLS